VDDRPSPPLDELLDAALDRIAASGLAKTSLSDIAVRTGLSRATAYRALGSKPELMARLAERETARFLAALAAAVAGDPRWPSALAFTLRYLREHAALQRVAREEPHELLALLVEGGERPAVMELLIEASAGFIAQGLGTRLRVTPREAAEWTVHAVYCELLLPAPGPVDADRLTDRILHGIAVPE
jgi:AcrR family transcriptional regulator